VFVALLRLQSLAFWRAPYLASRLALAALKAAGVLYAVGSAAILGVVLPDLLGVVAPGVDALAAVERGMLTALGALTGLRLLFQDVPTRGAWAFLLLPVSRRRVAAGVLARSLASPFTLVPLVFAVPFALRTVSADAGTAGAAAWTLVVVAVVVLSHAVLVAWKTQLGVRPLAVVASAALAVGVVAGLDVATGSVLETARSGGLGVVAGLLALAAGGLVLTLGGLASALSLDAPMRSRRRTPRRGGFERPGVRAFLDLDLRLVTRASFPRGISVNAFVLSVALSVVAAVGSGELPSDLMLIFSAGALAGSVGQFAVPLTSGHYDRLMTLPESIGPFVRAKWVGMALATLGLGVVQATLVLALAPTRAWLIGVSVLFSLGVLAPAALWGSTFGPKPIDLAERVTFNYKVQSFGGQVMVGATAALAGALVVLGGPRWGPAVAAALGLVGIATAPLWHRALADRIVRQRHAVGARFRASL